MGSSPSSPIGAWLDSSCPSGWRWSTTCRCPGSERSPRTSSARSPQPRWPASAPDVAHRPASGPWRHEPLDEAEHLVGDLAPAMVDDERVPAVGDLDDLGHALISLLPLVRGV